MAVGTVMETYLRDKPYLLLATSATSCLRVILQSIQNIASFSELQIREQSPQLVVPDSSRHGLAWNEMNDLTGTLT